jgi:tellurite resistance protein TerC
MFPFAIPFAAVDAGAPAHPSLDASATMWIGLGVLVVLMLLVDLFIFARGRTEPTLKTSLAWSGVWITLAGVFGAWLWSQHGSEAGGEFFAGYLLEKSLSIDNLFVFAVIFGFFAVPAVVQPRVLAWGIALALVLRLIFILAGAALLDSFHLTMYAFGALLLYTGYKLARHKPEDMDLEDNKVLGWIRRHIPMTDDYRGPRLLTKENGKRIATPLFAVFAVIATTDVMFAIDSIPAVYAVTDEPFIVFAANAFALLGLRALYFALAGLMDRFSLLSYGLAALLGLVGVKMLLADVWHAPTWLSLVAIVVILGSTAVLSILKDRRAVAAG